MSHAKAQRRKEKKYLHPLRLLRLCTLRGVPTAQVGVRFLPVHSGAGQTFRYRPMLVIVGLFQDGFAILHALPVKMRLFEDVSDCRQTRPHLSPHPL